MDHLPLLKLYGVYPLPPSPGSTTINKAGETDLNLPSLYIAKVTFPNSYFFTVFDEVHVLTYYH